MQLSHFSKVRQLVDARTALAEAAADIRAGSAYIRDGWREGYLIPADMAATRAKLLDVHAEALARIDEDLAALGVVIDQTPAAMIAAAKAESEEAAA